MTFDPAAARKRCEGVTPGPWFYESVAEGGQAVYCHESDGEPYYVALVYDDEPTDAAFIAASRTDLPQALDRIAELEAREQALRGYVTHGWRCATRDVRSSCYHLPRLPDDEHCDCGLREALAATAPKGVET